MERMIDPNQRKLPPPSTKSHWGLLLLLLQMAGEGVDVVQNLSFLVHSMNGPGGELKNTQEVVGCHI